MATPTLRALRGAFPDSKIVGVMRPVLREVLDQAWGAERPWLDETLLLNKRRSPTASSRWGLVQQIRQSGAQLAVLLTNSLWSAAVVRLAGVSRVVGYRRDGRGLLLSDALEAPRDGKRWRPISPVDYYLQLAHWLGCDSSNRAMQLGVSSLDEQLADGLWSQLGFSAELPTIAINSGSANSTARLWPAEHVQELASRLAGELGVQVLLHCGPAEREACNRLADAIAHPRVASMGVAEQLPIGLSKAVLKRSAAVVSTDSGPRHLAVAFDRPVVSLFGPTSPDWTTTYNRPELLIGEQLDCRGCLQATCPLKHNRCMRDITVDRVLAAVRKCLTPAGSLHLPGIVLKRTGTKSYHAGLKEVLGSEARHEFRPASY